MKKISWVSIYLILFSILLMACSSSIEKCSISDCKNDVYKNGLCPDHYVESIAMKNEIIEDNSLITNKEIENNTDIENQTSVEDEEKEDEKELSSEDLEKALSKQPCFIKETKYIVQDEQYKSIYPDILSVVIKNNSKTDIKSAVVAFVAWDKNNLPIKLIGQYDFNGGSYVQECNFEDINLIDGDTYDKGSGLAISEDNADVETFKAIIVNYNDFDGNTWENPYYQNWLNIYENKKLNK